jgi:hypothetical protein
MSHERLFWGVFRYVSEWDVNYLQHTHSQGIDPLRAKSKRNGMSGHALFIKRSHRAERRMIRELPRDCFSSAIKLSIR